MRVCYNCDDKFHFFAECPYERREDHNGRLVLKDKSKITKKKPFVKKKKFNKKQTKVVLLNKEEEYSTGDEESEDDDGTSSEVAAIATTSTSTSSLFDSPNENLHNKNVNCFMARATEVSPSVSSSPNSINDDKDDATSLKIKEEIVALDYFLSNVQGESKKHFEAILR